MIRRFATLLILPALIGLAGCDSKSSAAPAPVANRPKLDAPVRAVASFDGPGMRSCDVRATLHQCAEYDEAALKRYTGVDHRGACPYEHSTWGNGPCPTQNGFATCAQKTVLTRYYWTPDLDWQEVKQSCSDNGGTFLLQP